MPLPLVWLGAGAAALYAGTKFTRELQKSRGYINHFPGESKIPVKPTDGAVVCCGIYEVFQHSGIWVDGQIIELRGNGLIRAISPERFLSERSGNVIYVACDESLSPLVREGAAESAASRVFEYSEYDLIENNCHRFTLSCATGANQAATRFSDLNQGLQQLFKTPIHWQPLASF